MMATHHLLWMSLLLVPALSQSLECSNYTVSNAGSSSEDCYEVLRHCNSLQLVLEHISNCSTVVVLDNQRLRSGIIFPHYLDGLLVTGGLPEISVTCENSSGLFFPESRSVSITNLHFVGCSLNVTELVDLATRESIPSFPLFSVAFYGGQNIRISECKFTNSNSSSLLLVDVKEAWIDKSHFTGTADKPGSSTTRSGGIVLRRSSKSVGDFTYTIEGCSFTANLAAGGDSEPCHPGVWTEEQPYIGYGGAVDVGLSAFNSTTDITIANSNFTRNRAMHGGAISVGFSSNNSMNSIKLIGSTFDSNVACIQGGAVTVFPETIPQHFAENSSSFVRVEDTTFKNNSAFWGGGISLYRCRTCARLSLCATNSMWTLNTALTSGYGVAIAGNSTSTEQSNTHGITSLVFYAEASFNNCKFLNNTNNGLYRNINAIGALYATACELKLTSNTLLASNFGTALILNGFARLTFVGNITFSENFGVNGGAIHALAHSQIRFTPGAIVLFANNKAMVLGGAVYSKPTPETYSSNSIPCLFEIEDDHNSKDITVTFEGNFASDADQAVYIGNADQCNGNVIVNNFTYIPEIKNQVQTTPHSIVFSTIPKMDNGTLKVMLGEEFFLDPTVTDKFGHSSTSYGYLALLLADSFKSADTANFTLKGPSSISADNFTKNNVLCITGPDQDAPKLVLEFLFDSVSSYRSNSAIIDIEITPCKVGFKYSPETRKCECSTDLDKNLICSDDGNATTACIKQGYWYNQDTKNTIPCPTTNCDYSNGKCPRGTEPCSNSPGYCRISHADDVCWVGRTGYLCSRCKEGYGFSFGALGCSEASTCRPRNTFLIMLAVFSYWLLIILILVAILTLNDLSMGSGFMYGLIYYFSVITLFADISINNIFLRYLISACISLTQLDPSVLVQFLPICFIKQMDDGLQHLMFRYVTPLFIICVIISIILLSRCRYCHLPKRMSLSQNSPIHALCILILFSYTGLSYTSFEILRPTVIDGNVRVAASPVTSYFDPKNHLPYAFFALLIELVIALPICIFFLCAPYLAKRVNLVKLRLLPILDEFQACYRPKYRWFAGFYFLARQLLYFVTLIPQNDLPQLNMLLQLINIVVLLVHTTTQPYKQWWLNVMDTIFLTDIVVFSLLSSLTASLPQLSGINWFIFEASPFVLIFIPAGYLIAVFSVLIIRRFWYWIKSIRQSRASRRSPVPTLPTHSEVTIADDSVSTTESNKNSIFTYSLFRDDGEREPLLLDAVAPHSSSYTDQPRLSDSYTHSSIELLPST